MANLVEDIKLATDTEYRNRVNSRYLDLDKFDFIYSRTNEDIAEIFKAIDVSDQDVCTVLSSSDYLFSIVDGGAKSVDTFDVNPLTYRYYHLRKWLLQEGMIDAEGLSSDSILEIVTRQFPLIPDEEKESAIFWISYLSKTQSHMLYTDDMFVHVHLHSQDMPYLKNVEELSSKLSFMQIGFQRRNICKSFINSDREYDAIFLSNILDYNRNNEVKLNVVVSNLCRLVKSGGKVVLTHFHGKLYDPDMNTERDAFANYFDYDPIVESAVSKHRSISYYQYVKK